MATWTSQDGGDPPVSYVSSRPWRRQERARVGVAPAHLYRPFQGRTVEDADRRANGACLPVPAGTRFCECGAVVIHNSHELGKLHRHRTQATQPSSRESTWTSQDGGDPPVSYVSSRPWRRQERARVGVAPAHLYRPFQGRTVEDADRRANGACLPVPAGTRFCECGAVVIHNSHELGKLHRHRTQATQPSSRESSQERSGAAVRAMLARAAQEADFAQWLLRVASGHASSE
ncbi:hypothetical protein MRX96_048386, partial [Rhipicephalus microplus]